MTEKNITANTVCKFDGICWDDWNRKHIDYESYSSNRKNQNTTFSIEIGIRKTGTKKNTPISTINIDIHFWKFNNDWEISSKSTEYEQWTFASQRRFNDFVYENSIMQYIKDELAFWCGIYDDKMIDSIYDSIKNEVDILF